MPQLSIIIPCYNSEKYLRDTLRSVQSIDSDDLEVICVNYNSSDDTQSIIDEFTSTDERFKSLFELEPGEGPARDAGLSAATGTWLFFLDSDDFIDSEGVLQAVLLGEAHEAEVVIGRAESLNNQTGEVLPLGYAFQTQWLPESTTVFDPHEHPTKIFNSFQNWPTNKLFRSSFVRNCELHFQHIHRTADLYFTCCALSEARRVALLDHVLFRYRIMNPSSAMATSDKFPLDFYHAFCALEDRLRDDGTFELYFDSFVSWAIGGIISNLEVSRTYEAFSVIANTMAEEGLDRLCISGFPAEKYETPWQAEVIRAMTQLPIEQFIFWYFRDLQKRNFGVEVYASERRLEIANLRAEVDGLSLRVEASEHQLKEAQHDLSCVLQSKSFGIGRAITAPGRLLRDKLDNR